MLLIYLVYILFLEFEKKHHDQFLFLISGEMFTSDLPLGDGFGIAGGMSSSDAEIGRVLL